MKYTIIRAYDKDGNSRILYSGPSTPESITVINVPASQDEEVKVQKYIEPSQLSNTLARNGYLEVKPIITDTTNK